MRSINLAGPFSRGGDAQFTATVNDPDGDAVELSWGATPGPCPPPQDSSQWPPNRMTQTTFTVSSNLTGAPFCVWAFATDRYGAVGVGNNVFSAGDRPPIAQIDAGQAMPRYRLYSTLKVDGSHSYDPDGDTISGYQWTLQAPSGADLSFVDCDTGDPKTVRCFQATQSGTYTASLKVQVAATGTMPPVTSAAATVKFEVLDDTPPCLVSSNFGPLTLTTILLNPHDDSDKNFFQVTVFDDDGGLYPPANAAQHITYSWFMTAPGAPAGSALIPQDSVLNILMIEKDHFTLADEAVVRVEIHDRQVEAIDQHLRDCGDAATCSTTDPITGEKCYQRFSWNVKWIL